MAPRESTSMKGREVETRWSDVLESMPMKDLEVETKAQLRHHRIWSAKLRTVVISPCL